MGLFTKKDQYIVRVERRITAALETAQLSFKEVNAVKKQNMVSVSQGSIPLVLENDVSRRQRLVEKQLATDLRNIADAIDNSSM